MVLYAAGLERGGMSELTYRKIMSVSDVSEMMSIHPETVRRMAKDGRLPSKKHGTMFVFDAECICEKAQDEIIGADRPKTDEPKPLYPAILTQPPFDTNMPKKKLKPQKCLRFPVVARYKGQSYRMVYFNDC